MQKIFFAVAMLSIGPYSLYSVDEKTLSNKIASHHLIADHSSALKEAKEAFALYPESELLARDLIRANFKAGQDKQALLEWKRYLQKHPDRDKTRGILEEVAWGIIENGARSTSPHVRLIALIASYLGQDARGVDLLEIGLKDHNSKLRAVALQLVGTMHDRRLQELVMQLSKKEPLYELRAEAVKCLGTMKVKESIPELIKIVGERRLGDKLRASAIASLVLLKNNFSEQDLIKLTESDRSGFRELALAVIDHNESFQFANIVFKLLKDDCRDVRIAAIHTLVTLRNHENLQGALDQIKPLLEDEDEETALVAAWAETILDPENGGHAFSKGLFSTSQDKRLKAAALLTKTGRHGLPFARKAFYQNRDLFVKMNLAMYLIKHGLDEIEGLNTLYNGLNASNERWMVKDFLFASFLGPSNLRFDDEALSDPEAENQKARLQVLALLATKKYHAAKEAVRQFLKEKTWGISANASSILLTEADESSFTLIEELLDDKEIKIRIQAALILSLWGGSSKAAEVLINNYESSDREKKLFIIEALGIAKDTKALPFLVSLFQDNYPTIRIAAAVSVIKTLYQ